MDIIGIEKKVCECVDIAIEHWVVKCGNGKIYYQCPCCGKMTFLDGGENEKELRVRFGKTT